MKSLLTGSLSILTLMALLAGCGRDGPSARTPQKPAVAVERVEARVFERNLSLTGTVEAAIVATLSSPAEGPVQDLRIREGDRVREDEVLLVIGRDASAEALLASAKEELSRQEREFSRVRSLVTDRALPGEQLDAARAALERARAQLAQAVQASSDFTVHAPWDGMVSRLHVADGRYLAPRTPLLDMFDPQSLVLRFQVPEEHAFLLEEGDLLSASFDAFGGQSMELAIERAWPELDRRLRTRTFEARLPLESLAFAPGQFARLSVVMESLPGALTVPVEAVMRDSEGGNQVFIVDSAKVARKVSVRTGFEQRGRVLIRNGLSPGDRVIITGTGLVKPGQQVRVQPSQTRQP